MAAEGAEDWDAGVSGIDCLGGLATVAGPGAIGATAGLAAVAATVRLAVISVIFVVGAAIAIVEFALMCATIVLTMVDYGARGARVVAGTEAFVLG
jgi:hypothetical protein